ncbi:transcription factor IIIB, Bdp1 subunit [Suhomyces tanzawaensis NRRL Y-17324]|uniref:Transcription factor IIIB, Bdp1 subunit n=1 Tax=Suhomyces tanzawaensis NRRL Y-17324 TaxID=984487 RepID=A0A1E4SK37_9ASCO|nr:transcription factor IIIB, Bdp1 subunit [Suhomyces tanzawaensis NRRL Y-17324]ODV79875.1 transcription factor IIIB, Bdp1 subunit [Suhomyces tanzawaensis NRRL Y-17324]
MSSIVKKSTHFTPKLRKKPIKKKVEKPQLTPPATQEKPQIQDPHASVENTSASPQTALSPAPTQLAVSEAPTAPTPEPTQAEPLANEPTKADAAALSPLKAFNFKVVPAQAEADVVDPRDSSQKLDRPDSGSDHSDLDLDIFKELPRRKSVQQRRLSGIAPILNRNRSTSISLASGGAIAPDASEDYTPAKIGIPLAKAVKRRRSLAQTRTSTKRASVIRAASISIPKEPSPVPEEAQSGITSSVKIPIKEGDGEFVVGIDPETARLSKFRVRPALEGADENTYEIAPDTLITNITSVKQLPRSVKGEDEELYRDIGFDINKMTMADLCKPTLPIGQVSSNYESVMAAEEKIKQKKLERRAHRELARVERVPLEEILARNGEVDDIEAMKKKRDELLNTDAPEQSHSTNLQLLLVDGVINYDLDSAIVSRHKGVDNSHLTREEANPFENPITSSSYSKRKHTDRWTEDEVKQFYSALSTFGTDFLLISQLFPYRTRKQIKLKFNLEEKNYPEIVEMALKRKLPADFAEYCEASKHNIKSLEYYNEKLREVRIAHEAELAAMALEREKAMKDDAEKNRQREIEFRTGAKSMTRAEKIKELRKNEMVVGSIAERPQPEDTKPII